MNIWAVNTNKSNFDNEKGAMIVLNQNRIVTWYRDDLKQISIGDSILSYNNNKKIIAVGYAISEVQKYTENGQNKTQENWIDVDFIWKSNKDLLNTIQLNDIETDNKVAMFNGIIFKWNKHIDTFKLLLEIGKIKIKGK